MSRHLILGALAVVLVPATVAIMLALMPDKPRSTLPFPTPAHRLAVAVETALRAEVPATRRGNFSVGQDLQYMRTGGKFASMDELRVPADYPAFWLRFGGNSSPPTLVKLLLFDLEGKTRDGREFRVTIRPDRIGEGSLADFHGDARLAQALAPKIAGHLAHPAHPHESAEDRAGLMAFFGSIPLNGGKMMGPFIKSQAPAAPPPSKVAVPPG